MVKMHCAAQELLFLVLQQGTNTGGQTTPASFLFRCTLRAGVHYEAVHATMEKPGSTPARDRRTATSLAY
jgi:hypothetical protein